MNKAIHLGWLGPELLVCCLAHRGPTGVFLLPRVSKLYGAQGFPSKGSLPNLCVVVFDVLVLKTICAVGALCMF